MSVPQEVFDERLKDILENDVSVGELLGIPGIYEILSEYYNNDVLDSLKKESEQKNHNSPGVPFNWTNSEELEQKNSNSLGVPFNWKSYDY